MREFELTIVFSVYLESWGPDAESTREDATDMLKALKQDWFADPALAIEEKYREL